MKELICGKCHAKLLIQKKYFRYMGYEVSEEVPCCPVCGQVYLDESMVRGRMQEAEMEMEDK